jgi:hypothetical protein
VARHKHADCIIAWANGETIEFKPNFSNVWRKLKTDSPAWQENYGYRVKPKEPNYGEIARDEWFSTYPLPSNERWERLADSVIKAYKEYNENL